MASRSIAIADAIVEFLNNPASPGWSQDFTAVRQLVPLYDVQDISALVVSVMPESDQATIRDRTHWRHECRTNVAVAKHLSQETNPTDATQSTDADAIIALLEELGESFSPGMAIGSTGACVKNYTLDSIFDLETLKNKRVLLASLTITSIVL